MIRAYTTISTFGLADFNPVVLGKKLQQLDPLLQHAVPVVAVSVNEGGVQVRRPLLE
jgi:hypothetical protein